MPGPTTWGPPGRYDKEDKLWARYRELLRNNFSPQSADIEADSTQRRQVAETQRTIFLRLRAFAFNRR